MWVGVSVHAGDAHEHTTSVPTARPPARTSTGKVEKHLLELPQQPRSAAQHVHGWGGVAGRGGFDSRQHTVRFAAYPLPMERAPGGAQLRACTHRVRSRSWTSPASWLGAPSGSSDSILAWRRRRRPCLQWENVAHGGRTRTRWRVSHEEPERFPAFQGRLPVCVHRKHLRRSDALVPA